jgi:hypothetical protein
MNLYNLKEVSEKAGVSRATIYRFYERNNGLWNETKIKTKKRLIPESHLSLITKSNIYTTALRLEEENKQLKRLVNLLSVPNTLQYRLYQMDWDYFGTIAFKNDLNQKAAYHQMLRAFDYLIERYGKKIKLRIFFTVEPFYNRDGNHIHFILRVGNGLLTKAVIEELKVFFKNDRVDLNKYDRYKAGIYYTSKQGLQGENWDILGNDFEMIKSNLF